jgi:hypothetical protein
MTQLHTPYETEITHWRIDREQKLRADDGWLTLCALAWLNDGDNSVGSDTNCDVVLPAHSVPPHLGKVTKTGESFTLTVSAETSLKVNGQPVMPNMPVMLVSDQAKQTPSLVTVGDVSFFVIKRGEQFAIRARDKNSNVLKSFTGCEWFPVQTQYRVKGMFTPHTPARVLQVVNILGILEPTPNPGTVEFEFEGRQYKFEAFAGGKDSLFIVFRDATAGKSTYGSGRFIYAPFNADGMVDLDFNKAYNPPCAFTTFATCTLPLPSNIMPAEIEAGEKRSASTH